jgi:hypothetical protein
VIIGLIGHGRLLLIRGFWANLMTTFVVVPTIVLCACSVLFVLFEKPFMRRNWHTGLLRRLSVVRGGRRGNGAQHASVADADALDLGPSVQN